MAPRDWNAHSYDNVSAPQQKWGATVVARLSLAGDETVLDAGAGTGRVSEMVLERLPHGHLIAVDGSPSMAARARERLPADRVSVICADLLELELPEPVDAVISTATFHWVHDHDTLFARMRAVLRIGGQFVAQCGGEGNIDRAREIGRRVSGQPPFAEHLAAMGEIWNYASVEQTRERLERAGFEVSACWIAPAPTTPPQPREFMQTVVFAPYLEHLPAELHGPFLDATLAELGEPLVLDYRRLNWDALAR
jgi:trans-aconitate 2-methyltransferase